MARYHAYFDRREVYIEASSLYAAKLDAIGYFAASPARRHMVSVVLFERDDGSPVSIFNSNAELG
jgi:hypothetical protein